MMVALTIDVRAIFQITIPSWLRSKLTTTVLRPLLKRPKKVLQTTFTFWEMPKTFGNQCQMSICMLVTSSNFINGKKFLTGHHRLDMSGSNLSRCNSFFLFLWQIFQKMNYLFQSSTYSIKSKYPLEIVIWNPSPVIQVYHNIKMHFYIN